MANKVAGPNPVLLFRKATMTDDAEYLRAADIARITGLSLRTARRWIADKIIPSTKLGGARLVARADLERLLSSASDPIQETTEEAIESVVN